MPSLPVLLASALVPTVLVPAPAQEELDPALPEGHSAHGQAFNEGPRQAAYLMPNPGNVHFPVTSDHPDVQAMFDQGVGQLHGFWYFEAERSFRQVAAWDPDCAMAYWGMSMANMGNGERAAAFAREAWERREHASERERMWIDAYARYHGVDTAAEEEVAAEPGGESDEAPGDEAEAEERDDGESFDRLVLDLEEIVRAHPDDVEAKAFLVVTCWFGRYVGREISSRQALQSMLDEVFAVHPDHPAHHYRIHVWDREETSDYVVDSAVASGPSWPSVAHMWHMGGHIFENLARHRDAAWQQEASARIDHAYMIRDLVLPDQIHNYAHNNEWLVRSLIHVGRVDEAVDLARNMVELPRHPDWNLPDMRGTSAFWGRRRLSLAFETFELWDDLLAAGDTPYLAAVDYGAAAYEDDADELGIERPTRAPGDAAIEDAAARAFALGLAHAYLGHRDERLAEVERLRELLDRARLVRAESLDAAEEEALVEKGDDLAAAREAMDRVLDEHAEPIGDLRDRVAILEALGRVLEPGEDEDVEAALAALEEHGYTGTPLARLHARAGLHERAEELARAAVEDRPGQAEALATLAHVLEMAGERDEALAVFEELRAISAELDLSVPTFRRLAPLAAAAGLPADWRVPLVISDDVGARPDLTTLGPLRWTPPAAPDWSATDAFGRTHTLADSSGRPRILILFLGFGCAHCVEQLQAFGPAADEFAAAGVDIVAIGDDPPQELASSVDAYPFPILADPDYEVFHAFRCYDDFEDAPLHGTFLIDAQDRLRWFDVSYEPFTDTRFLLEETKRLLGLSAL